MVEKTLKILIIDENPVRAAILEAGLIENGYRNITKFEDYYDLQAKIFALDPEVILIDIENPNRDVLEQLFNVSRTVKRPIAMFVDHSDSAMIQASVDAGVSAYIVDGLQQQRIKPILDMTISRFHAFTRMQNELDHAKSALEDRKVIDKAKGILMKQKTIDEAEAYSLIRKTAMNKERKMADIARSIITAAELLDGAL